MPFSWSYGTLVTVWRPYVPTNLALLTVRRPSDLSAPLDHIAFLITWRPSGRMVPLSWSHGAPVAFWRPYVPEAAWRPYSWAPTIILGKLHPWVNR